MNTDAANANANANAANWNTNLKNKPPIPPNNIVSANAIALPGSSHPATAPAAEPQVSKQQPKDKNDSSGGEWCSDLDLCPHDVLFGRGASCDRYVGNARFRLLIQQERGRYLEAENNYEKDRIARSIVRAVQSIQGRFLRRKKTESAAMWQMVTNEEAIEKVKQALRDFGKRGSAAAAVAVAALSSSDKLKSVAKPSSAAVAAAVLPTIGCSSSSTGSTSTRYSSTQEDVRLLGTTDALQINSTLGGSFAPMVAPTSTTFPVAAASGLSSSKTIQARMIPPPPPPHPSFMLLQGGTPVQANNIGGVGSSTSAAAAALLSSVLNSTLFQQQNQQQQQQQQQQALGIATAYLQQLQSTVGGGGGNPFIANTSINNNTALMPLPSTAQALYWKGELSKCQTLLLALRLSSSSTSSSTCLKFTSSELHRLLQAQDWAESVSDLDCLCQIRTMLRAVLQLPVAQIGLDATDVHDLIRALQKLS